MLATYGGGDGLEEVDLERCDLLDFDSENTWLSQIAASRRLEPDRRVFLSGTSLGALPTELVTFDGAQ